MKTAVTFRLRQTLGFFQRRDRPAAESQSFLAYPKGPVAQQFVADFPLQPFINPPHGLLILFRKFRQQHRADFSQLTGLKQHRQIIKHRAVGRAGELTMKVVVDRFHIKHNAVAQLQQLGLFPKINDSIGIDQAGFPGRLDKTEEFRQKIGVKHTFPAADRNPLNKREGFRNPIQ